MIIVRYSDDAVLGLKYREEAEQFLEQLRERPRKSGLELHPDKTRLIEFGRYAADRRKKRGKRKPETLLSTKDDRQTDGSQAEGHSGEAAQTDARVNRKHGGVAEVGDSGLFPIPRDSGQ